jgi:iron-sulfur cluster assembly protein
MFANAFEKEKIPLFRRLASLSETAHFRGERSAGLEPARKGTEMARARPSVLKLTDHAAERVREIIGHSDRPVAGVRVGVKNGGCAGMSYTLNYVEAADPRDERIEDKGITLFIEPKAVLFLIGTTMDYRDEKLRSGFVFENPNEISACGCGESVMLKPAEPEAMTAGA